MNSDGRVAETSLYQVFRSQASPDGNRFTSADGADEQILA